MENLLYSRKYRALSQVIEDVDPYGFPGRRQTPFVPIFTLKSQLAPDNSINGYAAGWNNAIGMRQSDDELRDAQISGVLPHSILDRNTQLVLVDTVGHDYLF